MKSPWAKEWRAAEQKERNSIRDKDVLGPLQLIPPGRKVRTMRYVYKWKPPTDAGSEPRAKVRATCRDFQWLGEVGETYAPTGRGLTFRLFLLIAYMLGMPVHHVDVETAFLNAELRPDEEYWTTPLPDEVKEAPPGWGYRLRKSIYGLRVAPRHWYQMLSDCLFKWGFQRSQLDTCLFWMSLPHGGLLMVLIYVDDILIAGPTLAIIQSLKDYLASVFTIVDLGEAKKYLGIRIQRLAGDILSLDQQDYAEEILRRFKDHWKPLFGGKKPKKTPLPADAQKFIAVEVGPDMTETEKSWFESFPYRSVIGCLLYLALNTRPDLSFAVGFLARASSKPTYGACYCAAWLLSYLSLTVEMGIEYTMARLADWHAFVDADWAGELARRRSTSGFVIFMCGGPLAWGSKLMQTIASSTMQAEFQSYYYCVTSLLYIKHMFEEIGIPYKKKVIMFTDAQAAIRAAHNPEAHQATKHFEVKYWWIRQFIGEGAEAFIEMHFLPTVLMVADILTKVSKALAVFLHTDHLMGRMDRGTRDVFEAKQAGKWQTPGFEDLPEFHDSSSSEGSDSEEA